MRNFLTVFSVFMSLILAQSNALACLPGFLKLNSVDGLSAEGLHGSKGLMVKVSDMRNLIIEKGRAIYNMTDNKTGVTTHRVEYLGTVSDQGGIIQTTYLVQDLTNNEEKIVVLKSNYQGNGTTARGLPQQGKPTTDSTLKQQAGFSNLYSVGCQ